MTRLKALLQSEAGSALPLLTAAVLALLFANSPFGWVPDTLFATRLTIDFGGVGLSKPLLLWVNDGLMAVFFLLVGLEIKREVVEGELSRPPHVVLPIAGAVGGMAVPAAIYAALNWKDPVALHGWAIPSATDIAFAVAVLAALGERVPRAAKLFLLTLAIVDDLASIVIIATFYTSDLSTVSLVLASLCIAGLIALNFSGVRRTGPYLLVGIILASLVNLFVHSSGVAFIVSILGVLIFSGLIAYDTQKIKEQYSEAWGTQMADKAAIFGALSLYLDFINLFQFLMSFMGQSRD
jgi:NhaA family Na+:H+ antiporter